MNKLFLFIFCSLWTSMCICQNGSNEGYRLMVKKRLVEDEKTISDLRTDNINLDRKVKELRQKNHKKDKKLEEVLGNLMVNNLLLQEKENDLKLLLSNYGLLENEYNVVIDENRALMTKLNKMENSLKLLNELNLEKEIQIVHSLDSIGKLNIALRAKDAAIKEILYSQRKSNNYIGFVVGFGAAYSGYGLNITSRLGKSWGVGIRGGIGILPNLYQTGGIYANGGINLFIHEICIDLSYHKELKHDTGYKYKDIFTSTVGYSYFLRNGIGAKASIGGVYRDGVVGYPEIDFTADVGIVYRFKFK